MDERPADLDLEAADRWIRSVVRPVGSLELERHRPWASVYRVPLRDGRAWFKACRPIQAFEPPLTAALASRWPDRVVRVLAHDTDRAWLLTADAGNPVSEHGNAPEVWLRALPLYGELQRGEADHVADQLANGVPDMRLGLLPDRYEQLLRADLPILDADMAALRRFGGRFAELCGELVSLYPAASIQHDDLHLRSLFVDGSMLRVLDWGDASIAHPFASLVATFRFLEEINGLDPADPWFERLRDAYLEPWGRGLEPAFAVAQRIGLIAHAIGWLRHREAMPVTDQPAFNDVFADLLRRVLERAVRSEPTTLSA